MVPKRKDIDLELGLTKQRSTDLNFFLYRRALHPELFHIYMEKHIEYSNFQADIWAIGLSHLVTVQSGGTMVTELTASPSDLLTDRNLVTQFRFRGERDFQYRFSDNMRYIFSSQVEETTEHIFRTTYRDLQNYAQKKGLLVPYEQWTTNGLVPFTFIDYEMRQYELHIHAYHAFPGEWRFLRTQSIFETEPGGRNPK
ncbi:MAG: DUF2617 family protein [Phycisphaerales bacterium]|nr:DUF2617 family protein [Phycisphaerales bacterium]